MRKLFCIITPIYNETPDPIEKLSLIRLNNLIGNLNYDVYFVTYKGLNIDEYLKLYPNAKISYFDKYYNSPLVNQDVEKIQIIAPVKERGDACVFNLNQDIQELLNPPRKNFKQKVLVSKKKDASGNDRSFWIQENDKVMCIKNNYNVYDENGVQTSIFNGWTGLVKKIEKDTDRDYIMTPQEALEYGMIDKVVSRDAV